MTSSLLNNRYQVLETLGSGGFGTTFLAEDTQMPSHRKCVIKQLKPIANNPTIYEVVQERFQREAAILEQLGDEHDQIPRLYAYFAEAGEFYLVQEWIEGEMLRSKVQSEGVQSEATVKQMLMSILPVLNYVHSKHIVHRDIKPDNIILRKRDGKPVLIDFGAVRETMGTMVNSQGESGSSIVIGTPGFMPSEQAAGRPLYSSDLYSLGLTMIYLLTGKFPQELDLDAASGEIVWRKFAPHVSPAFADVLDKAIQYHPRDRYPSAQALLEALQTAKDELPDIPNLVSDTAIQAATVRENNPSTPPTFVPPTVINPANPAVPQPALQPVNSDQLPKEVPIEAAGWNWGAFLLPGFWCINNQVWLGLLAWSGLGTWMLGWFIAGGILGAKGNEMAWKSRRWKDVQAFKRNQRNWAIAGFLTWGSIVGAITAAVILAPPTPEQANSETTDSIASSLAGTGDSNANSTPSSPAATPVSPLSGIAKPNAQPSPSASPVPPSETAPTLNEYPEHEIQAYLDSCISSAMASGAQEAQARTYCGCTIQKFQAQYTYQQFAAIALELQSSQQVPPELNRVFESCIPQ